MDGHLEVSLWIRTEVVWAQVQVAPRPLKRSGYTPLRLSKAELTYGHSPALIWVRVNVQLLINGPFSAL
jgi:hypothetical protein